MNRTTRLELLVVVFFWFGSTGLSFAAVPKTDNAALVYYQALMFVDDLTEEERGFLRNLRLNAYNDNRDTRGLVSGKGRWAIDHATIASRMPNCDWGLIPEQSPVRKWGPDDLLLDLALLIRLDVKFSVTEDAFTALERCNTLRSCARQLEKEHQVLFTTTAFMEKMGLDGLIYMVQTLADDKEMLHWLERQVAENTFPELSLVRFFKHHCDNVVRNCLTRNEARIVLEQDGHDPNEEPYRSTLSLTDEEWIRFRTDPYVAYTNDIIDWLQQDLGYEQTLTKIKSPNTRYHSEATDHWAVYHDDALVNRGTCYAGVFHTKSQVNVLKNAIKLYLIILDTGRVPDVLPTGMAMDPHTGRDFIYERTLKGFLLRCQTGKHYRENIHEFVFEVNCNNETDYSGIQLEPRSSLQGLGQEEQFPNPQSDQVTGPASGEDWQIPALGMAFAYVAPGSFQMGSNDGKSDEAPVHTVKISKGYWMGKYEVTQQQFQAIMGVNPSGFKGSSNPVATVYWDDCVSFCRKLTDQERRAGRLPSGFEYRLPTEAEWEYAARGGAQGCDTKYAGSDSIDSVARYGDNSDRKTHSVGQKQANELGLYDMSGSVWEWCHDWFGSYSSGSQTDPVGPSTGSDRVYRGGGFLDGASFCRVAFRGIFIEPSLTHCICGFRVVLAAPVNEETYRPNGD